MKKKVYKSYGKQMMVALAAVVLVGGSFSIASGEVPGMDALAAVSAAISGAPTLIVSRDTNSPKGIVPAGSQQLLAAFDLKAKNVTHWVTLRQISGQIVINGTTPSWLYAANPMLQYYYCIPSGVSYGYGWVGTGNCKTMVLNLYPANTPSNKITGVQTFYFSGIVPVFPQASPSILYVYGTPLYSYTGSATKGGTKDATLQVQLTNLAAVGDRCSQGGASTTTCTYSTATVNVVNNGNNLTIPRPYGYGYKGAGINAVWVSPGAQPANSLAPQGAIVPYTTFTLTNYTSKNASISSFTVQHEGVSSDSVFHRLRLTDQTGKDFAITAAAFNSSHQMTIPTKIILKPGDSVTITIDGDMSTNLSASAGQTASLSLIAINTTTAITGSLPVTGATQTINSSLTNFCNNFNTYGYRCWIK